MNIQADPSEKSTAENSTAEKNTAENQQGIQVMAIPQKDTVLNIESMISQFFENIPVDALFTELDFAFFKNGAMLRYITDKKKKLVKKLEAVQKEAIDPKYKVDLIYTEGVNKKLTVLREYKNQYLELEERAKAKIAGLSPTIEALRSKAKYFNKEIGNIKTRFTRGRLKESDYLELNGNYCSERRKWEEREYAYTQYLRVIDLNCRRKIKENGLKLKISKEKSKAKTTAGDEQSHLEREIECAEVVLEFIKHYI